MSKRRQFLKGLAALAAAPAIVRAENIMHAVTPGGVIVPPEKTILRGVLNHDGFVEESCSVKDVVECLNGLKFATNECSDCSYESSKAALLMARWIQTAQFIEQGPILKPPGTLGYCFPYSHDPEADE